jgi:hypothetical protein
MTLTQCSACKGWWTFSRVVSEVVTIPAGFFNFAIHSSAASYVARRVTTRQALFLLA